MLINTGDAVLDHRLGIAKRHGPPRYLNTAMSGSDGARQNLDQGRLACAIGPDQGAHFAGHDSEIGITQGREVAINLGEPRAADEGRRIHVSPFPPDWLRAGAAALLPGPGHSRWRQAGWRR